MQYEAGATRARPARDSIICERGKHRECGGRAGECEIHESEGQAEEEDDARHGTMEEEAAPGRRG